jgi:hypothetical protein
VYIRHVFKHYILCRYNHRLYSDNPYNIGDPDAWMNSRRPLFERLLRSLANQTNSEFRLLLTIDPHTPNPLRRQIEMGLEESGVPATTLDVAPMDWLKCREPEADYLLTSRVDNDDEYLPNFVQAVQADFSPGTEILDVRGVQCDGQQYYTLSRAEPNSPFLSLLEPWHDVKTAHFENHNKMTQLFPARFVAPEILFIQHVHNSNVLNKITGKPLPPDEVINLPPLSAPNKT